MDIKGEYQIAADRKTVWTALNDPDILSDCIPGCESLQRTGDNQFEGKSAAAIGPVRAKFNLLIRLENVVAPESYTLAGESKAGPVGFGRGRADVALREQDGGTLLTYTAEFKVGGKLAQVGSRLVVGATKKMADDFFGCLSRQLQTRDAGTDTVAPAPADASVAAETPQGRALSRDPFNLPLLTGVAITGLLVWWFLVR
jgi:hypothetical protein